MYTKKWYKSKTLWINVLCVGGGILTAISGFLASGGILTFLGIANIVLRVFTDSGVTFTGKVI